MCTVAERKTNEKHQTTNSKELNNNNKQQTIKLDNKQQTIKLGACLLKGLPGLAASALLRQFFAMRVPFSECGLCGQAACEGRWGSRWCPRNSWYLYHGDSPRSGTPAAPAAAPIEVSPAAAAPAGKGSRCEEMILRGKGQWARDRRLSPQSPPSPISKAAPAAALAAPAAAPIEVSLASTAAAPATAPAGRGFKAPPPENQNPRKAQWQVDAEQAALKAAAAQAAAEQAAQAAAQAATDHQATSGQPT